MRMFAGPNGSGKSTLKKKLLPELRGYYINPDELEAELQAQGFIDLGVYGVTSTADELPEFFRNSVLLKKGGLSDVVEHLRFAEGRLNFASSKVNAYFASVAADFIRQKLLERKASFTFETVMSSPDKVELLKQTQSLGYRTYFWVCMPQNISRPVRAQESETHSPALTGRMFFH